MPEPSDRQLARQVRRYLLLLLLVAVVLAAWGIASRIMARSALARETGRSAIPTVLIVTASRSAAGEELVLPGTVQAFVEAPIYARTSGYLKTWLTDIGSRVKKGQLLAEIETPEVDQQLRQAQADLETAQANLSLSMSTNARWQGLLSTDSVSRQDADEKSGDFAAKKAALASAAANLARLRDLTGFKRVVAPFDGVVTARNTDIGALINAGQNAGSELFRIAETSRLRIYVQVPERYAAVTQDGVDAELRFSERPGKGYEVRAIHTSNSLDPTLRTLQVELPLDNGGGEILPGAYAEVHFKIPSGAASLRLPANTVVFRSAGLQVATVDASNHVTLKGIVQGRDFGNTIEVLSGITEHDRVVQSPPDSIMDGMTVAIAAPPDRSSKGGGKAP